MKRPRPTAADPAPAPQTTGPQATGPQTAGAADPQASGRTADPAAADRTGESPADDMIVVRDLHRTFGSGPTAVHALRGVSFRIPRGRLIALKGRSGSGKTTLLNLVGGLDAPDRGTITVDGTDLTGLDEDRLLALRRDRIGFVFQSFGLIPILTAAENVGVPMRLRHTPTREREERIRLLLSLVGLADHGDQRPGELSGGQQQRVAIARALANRPALIIADEPTGQLDTETGHSIMELLRAVVHGEHVTALVATHDQQLMSLADHVLELRDGHIVSPDGE
jgi:putative ABC transport system ATP-binding protein